MIAPAQAPPSLMQRVHLGATQERGTMRWVRALLVPIGDNFISIFPLLFSRIVLLVVILIFVSWDAADYNGRQPKIAWVMYGPSLAQLQCLFAVVLDIALALTCGKRFDDGGDQAPMPWLAKAAWIAKVLALVAITTALILCVDSAKRLPERTGLIIVFTFMAAEFLWSNTPYLIFHVIISHFAIQAYLLVLFIYEYVFAVQVYRLGLVTTMAVVALTGVVHVSLVAVQEIRNKWLQYVGRDVIIWVPHNK